VFDDAEHSDHRARDQGTCHVRTSANQPVERVAVRSVGCRPARTCRPSRRRRAPAA
jgi:hypothetical protein